MGEETITDDIRKIVEGIGLGAFDAMTQFQAQAVTLLRGSANAYGSMEPNPN